MKKESPMTKLVKNQKVFHNQKKLTNKILIPWNMRQDNRHLANTYYQDNIIFLNLKKKFVRDLKNVEEN